MNIATILSPFQSKNMYQIYNIDVIIWNIIWIILNLFWKVLTPVINNKSSNASYINKAIEYPKISLLQLVSSSHKI